MVDIAEIKGAARIVEDEHGESVVQIPLQVWEAVLGELEADVPQHIRLRALLEEWAAEPDDTPAEWWEDFDKFMVRENN